MTVFKALKKLMLKLRGKADSVKFKDVVEVDELYVNAGLKGRNNSICIKRLGRFPRCRGFRRRGRGLWGYDKPAIFIIVGRGGGEEYVPSRNVESEAVMKIIGRRIQKESTMYTDSFKSYLGLSKLGYRHEYVNHSEDELVRGRCHINNCENRASLLRPWPQIHRGICKDNINIYLTVFKTSRILRKIQPIQAIKETIKIIYITITTTFLLKSEAYLTFLILSVGITPLRVLFSRVRLWSNAIAFTSSSTLLTFLEFTLS